MEESSFEALFPNLKDEAALLEVIRAVKAARLDKRRRQKYAEIAGTLINAGAEAFLIACTELSVIGPLANTTVPAIDTLDALVEGTIRSARNFLNTTSPRRL
jgi:aspartate racemase